MASMVLDRRLEERLKAERALSGADRFDEVWEGIYMMAPLADDEHQELQLKIGSIFQTVVGWSDLGEVRAGVNVSDRAQGWEHNYRCPDVAVFMAGTRARKLAAHWMGGPDFAVEIVSPDDRSRDKLEFYASVNVRELLIIDRYPWTMELFALKRGELKLVASTAPGTSALVQSSILPLHFGFAAPATDRARPRIEICRTDGSERWIV